MYNKQYAYWEAVCDCGNTVVVKGCLLRRGSTRSCGCLAKELLSKRTKTHGMTGSKIRNVWYSMVRRCDDPNVKGYKYYGKRGITVCEKWLSFEGFYKDMGDTYVEGLTLERIDNKKGYCKENCKWATRIEQANNTKRNRIITVKGEKLTLAQASRKYNINYGRLKARINAGWDHERAVFEPKRGSKNV